MYASIAIDLARLEQHDLMLGSELTRRHLERRHTHDEISGRPPDATRTLPSALHRLLSRAS